MNISILDCTLRDGAYITNGQWNNDVIKGIICNLNEAGIDYIEVGWLKDFDYKDGSSYFQFPSEITPFLPEIKKAKFLAMIDVGKYDIKKLNYNHENCLNGIRLVFQKDNFIEAIEYSNAVKQRNYELYLQAYNTPCYTDEEIKVLAKNVNKLAPEALYIVDTNGCLYSDDFKRIFFLLDKFLDKSIKIGFHSHNNLQLSFALAIEFINVARETDRNIIIDSSLCGIGRGAGNACTELIANYLDEKLNYKYDMNTILDTADKFINAYSQIYKWGYSLPLAVAGSLGAHVNNVKYLQDNNINASSDIKKILETVFPEIRRLCNYEAMERALSDYKK